jgi:hypothetical protein
METIVYFSFNKTLSCCNSYQQHWFLLNMELSLFCFCQATSVQDCHAIFQIGALELGMELKISAFDCCCQILFRVASWGMVLIINNNSHVDCKT